jgi:hypothetical protein
MKLILHFLRTFAVFFGAIMVVAAGINFLRGNPSLNQYNETLRYVALGVTGLGAIFVYAGGSSRRLSDETSGYSEQLGDEIRKEAERGIDWGLELFYSGLASTIIIWSLSS